MSETEAGTACILLRFVDVATGGAAEDVRPQFRSNGGDRAPVVAALAELGVVTIESGGPVTITGAGTRWHLLAPSAEYRACASNNIVQDVLVYSMIKVRGVVRCEDPSQVTRDHPAVIVAGPIRKSHGESHSDPRAVGSPGWLEVNARDIRYVRAYAAAAEFTIDVPAIGEVGVCVCAPGHLPEMLSVMPPYAIVDGEVLLHFDLRRAESFALNVTDSTGAAVVGASVQFIARRRIPFDRLHFEKETLMAAAAGAGLGIKTDGRATADIKFLTGARTDGEGRARGHQAGPADEMYVIVIARGHEPYVKRLEKHGEFDDCDIRLASNSPKHASYRILFDGEPVRSGSLVLSLLVDGMTPALPTIRVRGGEVSSALIQAGREYVFFLTIDAPLRVVHGMVEFGDDRVIDFAELIEK